MKRWLGLLLVFPFLAHGQMTCPVRHLSIFGANVAEVLEERTLELQAGLNTVEWRSLMPQAVIATVRVTGEQVTVMRQDITFDGTEVGNVKSPVLHLVLRNAGASGPRIVQVDLVAGDVQLLSNGSGGAGGYAANAQVAYAPAMMADSVDSGEAAVAGLSVFSRLALERNISIPANTLIAR